MPNIESDRLSVAVLDAELRAHAKADEAGFSRINTDTSEIKATLRDMAADLKSAVERIHNRIESEADKVRAASAASAALAHSETERAALVARADSKLAMDYAQGAHDRIGEQKNWILTALVTLTVAIIAWLGDRFIFGKH